MVLSALKPYAFRVTFVLPTLLGIYIYIYTHSELQKLMHKTYQQINISRPLYLHFILTSTVSKDMLCVF